MGLDLSLTGTGLVVLSRGTVRHRHLPTLPINRLPKSAESAMHRGIFHGSDEERIGHVAFEVMKLWQQYQPALVVIEEYAFSKNTSRAHALGELGGVVKHYLWLSKALILTVESTKNKLWATGDGRASKEDMIARARQLWPKCPQNDDIADAFHLARFGFRKYESLVEAAA